MEHRDLWQYWGCPQILDSLADKVEKTYVVLWISTFFIVVSMYKFLVKFALIA